MVSPYDSAVAPPGIYLEKMKFGSHKSLHTGVYSNFTHNSQNLKAT